MKNNYHYHGQFKDGQKHGKGILEDLNTGKIFKQTWWQNQRIDDQRIF
tara:strand:+ start:323 stop:466 length:144 start_codon:yes stop_codon:yes gene_type:complete